MRRECACPGPALPGGLECCLYSPTTCPGPSRPTPGPPKHQPLPVLGVGLLPGPRGPVPLPHPLGPSCHLSSTPRGPSCLRASQHALECPPGVGSHLSGHISHAAGPCQGGVRIHSSLEVSHEHTCTESGRVRCQGHKQQWVNGGSSGEQPAICPQGLGRRRGLAQAGRGRRGRAPPPSVDEVGPSWRAAPARFWLPGLSSYIRSIQEQGGAMPARKHEWVSEASGDRASSPRKPPRDSSRPGPPYWSAPCLPQSLEPFWVKVGPWMDSWLHQESPPAPVPWLPFESLPRRCPAPLSLAQGLWASLVGPSALGRWGAPVCKNPLPAWGPPPPWASPHPAHQETGQERGTQLRGLHSCPDAVWSTLAALPPGTLAFPEAVSRWRNFATWPGPP